METLTTPQHHSETGAMQDPPPTSRGWNPQRFRRARRGRASRLGREHSQAPPTPDRVPPQQAQTQAQTVQPAEPLTSGSASNGSRSQRGSGRSKRRGGGIPARAFRGQLTRPDQNAENTLENEGFSGNTRLRADVPEFTPQWQSSGIGSTSRRSLAAPADDKAMPKAKATKSRPKVITKSTAPDFSSRIHEDIINNLYECPICTGELGRRSRIWSCSQCWTVFHLSCVKKWSKNEGAAFQDAAHRQQQEGSPEASTPRAWRCPGCNLPHEVFPSMYTCWCEKETDPRPLPGLPPHSCGQTCSRPRKSCPHPCDSTCHAGPCAPCTAVGPTQDCFCGKNSSTKRCQDTDYVNGWSCGETCGDLLPCGEHTCTRPCHEGLCGSCEVKVSVRCYCGKVKTEMACSSKGEELDSQMLYTGDVEGTIESWTGCSSCGEVCGRPFDCGVHFCQKSCHPQEVLLGHCPMSADVITNCPCGKTPLVNIPGFSPRTSCEDPIPNCLEPCGKILLCGHPCEKVCHTGSCGPCMRRVSIYCRCGRSSSMTLCHQGVIEQPQCLRVCKATLHCGRHTCMERCCTGEQKAIERQAARRKLKAHNRATGCEVEAEHICTRVCGRMLKCGRHTCPELCHKGACNTCREAVFEEISCDCGRSVLYPPLPCGTQPPYCSFPCERPKSCGHPQTNHNCHTNEEACPKCPFLMEKICLCGKRLLKNQPCWLTDVRCGQICGEPLKCGSHSCQKNCHGIGECEDSSKPCQQACMKIKTVCGHPCTEPCHAPYPCPEKTPCSSMITVTCGCGRLRQTRRCNAAKATVLKGQEMQPQRLPSSTLLACDEECSRLERNRSLASALGVDIDPATTISQNLSSTNLPYSSETLDMYTQLSASSPLSTLETYESTLHSLASSVTQRSTRFQPARSLLRAFVHSLAADWGFATESFDPEPHRHVFVLKPAAWKPPHFGMGTPPSIGIGGMSVGECVKTRERHRNKEREAQRTAAAEARAMREATKTRTNGASDDGWAQVVSRRGAGASNMIGMASTPGVLLHPDSILSAHSSSREPRKERLVLRTGVGSFKQLQKRSDKVADNWEEEMDKEEEQSTEEKEQQGRTQSEHEHDETRLTV